MADETQPWAERTVEVPRQRDGFRRGVAPVAPRRMPRTEQFSTLPEEPADAGWPGNAPRVPASRSFAQLRRGGEWSAGGALFAFVCWGIWAISARGDLTVPLVTFVFTLLVALGLFALCRLVGRVIWERQLGRIRRSARGSHLVTAIFLIGVGIAYLRQTEWVMSAWNWVTG